jgi:hypothetical protein
MEEDIGQDNNKVKVMLDWYLKNPDNLSKIGRLFHGKWKLHKDVKDMHELSMGEAQEFEIKLNEAMKKKGAIAAPEEEAGLNG